eukprot:910950-Pleurochrysis_carterae.AAC.6
MAGRDRRARFVAVERGRGNQPAVKRVAPAVVRAQQHAPLAALGAHELSGNAGGGSRAHGHFSMEQCIWSRSRKTNWTRLPLWRANTGANGGVKAKREVSVKAAAHLPTG